MFRNCLYPFISIPINVYIFVLSIISPFFIVISFFIAYTTIYVASNLLLLQSSIFILFNFFLFSHLLKNMVCFFSFHTPYLYTIDAFKMTNSNYRGLSYYYWSSSQNDSEKVLWVRFNGGYLATTTVSGSNYVRLGTTF